MTTSTVYIVDDDMAVRDSLKMLLEEEGLAVLDFDSGESFLDACSDACRGCAILDVRMPGMEGPALQAELLRRQIRLPLIFLTGHGDIPMSVRAIKAGAVDFLTKPVAAATLLAAVRAALEQDRTQQAEEAQAREAHARLGELTEREKEVLRLAIAGLQNKEIARNLGISHRTVEIHRARILHKTATSSVLELARLAEAGGLSPSGGN